jgi:hypothetical protein
MNTVESEPGAGPQPGSTNLQPAITSTPTTEAAQPELPAITATETDLGKLHAAYAVLSARNDELQKTNAVLMETNKQLAADYNELKATGQGAKVVMKSGHVVTIQHEFPKASPDTAKDIIYRIIRRWGKYVLIIVLAIAIYLIWSLLATLEANGIDVNFYYQEALKGTADWFKQFLPAGCR